MKFFPRGNLLPAVLVSLGAFLVTLKLADVALGMYLGTDLPTPRFIALAEHPPNLDLYYRLPARLRQAPERIHFRTDADGFILGPDRVDGPVDIVFVGGSTTECAAIKEEYRFPYLVSEHLHRAATGDRVRTMNAGHAGNNSLEATFVILAKVLKYRPRAVVLMESVNDYDTLVHNGSYWQGSRELAPVQQRPSLTFSDIARETKNFLFPNVWLQSRILIARLFPAARFVGETSSQAASPQVLEDFRSSLTSAVGILRAWHVQPVLMTQFNRIEEDNEEGRSTFRPAFRGPATWPEYVALYKSFNETIRKVAAAHDVPLIDLDHEVPKTAQYVYDDVHVTEAGSKLVAEIVAKELAGKLDFVALASKREVTSH